MVDMVTPRAELRNMLVKILSLLKNKGPAGKVLAMPNANGGASPAE